MSDPQPIDTARGHLETLLEVARNDLPQDGPAATIVEQAEAALEVLEEV